jgi:hypothetical protein
MDQRNLGSEGLVVSSLGLGCMGMSEFYGTANEVELIATIHQAGDRGWHQLPRHRGHVRPVNQRKARRQSYLRQERGGRSRH